jgi:hypothetical protein
LSSIEDPHCHSCKRAWSRDFINENFPFTFRGNTLRIHRRDVLVSLERSRLPAMQVFVEAKRRFQTYVKIDNDRQLLFIQIQKQWKSLRIDAEEARQIYHSNRADKNLRMTYLEKLRIYRAYNKDKYTPAYVESTISHRQLNYYRDMYLRGDVADAAADDNAERRQFHMKCSANDCRGFISQTYICGTCNKKTCSECIEILEEGHSCKPESVESAKAIKKETRACPKCATRIFKIDGCDQMWCTIEGCNTAFSWNTGKVVSGRVHNPHYYEWLRQNNGGNPIQREVGDVQCGGIPDPTAFVRRTRYTQLTDDKRVLLLSVFRFMFEIEARMDQYPMTMHPNTNKDINVQYLMNEIDEATWKKQLEMNEMAFIRKKEIGQILQTFMTAGTDILREIYEKLPRACTLYETELIPENEEWITKVGIPNLVSLREYTSNALLNLGKTMRMAVPNISSGWVWVSNRAYYNKKTTPLEPIQEETV